MASRREVVVATENYLRSKGYNNSTGKYDRVIMGVKSLLGETLLTYGSPEFERAIQQETERMLKKYVKDEAMEYDPITCMMVPAKDQRAVDAPLDIFADIDSDVKEDLTKFKKAIDNAKTAKELENIENAIRNELSQVIDEYLSIWNEVGKYAQRSKNDAVIKFNSLATMAFKKYNSLSGK